MIAVGDKLVAHAPIQLSEDQEWPIGTVVEVAQVRAATPRFGTSYELQAADGSIGSFAEIDIEGEHAWFHRQT